MQGSMVEVEAAISSGLPRTVLVGLPDAALHEARDRCRAAVCAAGLSWPSNVLTINLTPAGLPKAGTHFDLAIAAATLAADNKIPLTLLGSTVMIGELGLDGRVRPVRGVLPALLAARRAGFERAIVPMSQRSEAGLVEGLTIWPVGHLSDVIDVLHGRPVSLPADTVVESVDADSDVGDLAEVIGQGEARRALEVAAAGRHHILLRGAPGCGKSMLARRLPSILPGLDHRDALEVTALHSLAGRGTGRLIARPPLAQPHHSVSMAAMVGGGARIAQPGAISLAHRGVLFLDEAPEFAPKVLDSLRGPLETGEIVIGRSQAHTTFPARFQLVMALNPCPCGLADDPSGRCTCTPQQVRRYAGRLSGPILDRVDVTVRMRPLTSAYLLDKSTLPAGESSAAVHDRVARARERAAARWQDAPWRCNAEVPGKVLRQMLPGNDATRMIDDALRTGRLTARGVDKVLRIAWTVADLEGKDNVDKACVAEALGMRRGRLR
nr:YifB family Mg chelatase-like AAA ATPase [Cutibacterium porci]